MVLAMLRCFCLWAVTFGLAACGGGGGGSGGESGSTGNTTAGSSGPTTTATSGPSTTDPTLGPGENCCEAHADPGCEEGAVQQCVCDVDPGCCVFSWDQACVAKAQRDCDATCMPAATTGPEPTGGGSGGSTTGVQSTGSCCWPVGEMGCQDPAVQTCVCGINPGCCDNLWDQGCVDLAFNQCNRCNGPGCCEIHPNAGCDDQVVQDCVCAFDQFCCQQEWDAQCVQEAVTQCMAVCP